MITGNEFYNLYSDGITFDLGNSLIENNIIHNIIRPAWLLPSQAHLDGIQSIKQGGAFGFNPYNVTIRGNSVYNIEDSGQDEQGIYISVSGTGTLMSGIIIENNLVYNIGVTAVPIGKADVIFRNNTVDGKVSFEMDAVIRVLENNIIKFCDIDMLYENVSAPLNENHNIINNWGSSINFSKFTPSLSSIKLNNDTAFENLFIDYYSGNFSPRMDKAACNGSINPVGVAVGALACVNGSTSAQIQTTNNITQFNITWFFDKQYQYGTFANGDYWVLDNSTGVNVINVDVNADDYNYGANSSDAPYSVVNPNMTYNGSNFDIHNLSGGQSLITIQKIGNFTECWSLQGTPDGWGVMDVYGICHKSPGYVGTLRSSVLTIVSQVPENNGATVFRPPFVGNEKPMISTLNLRKELLPKIPYSNKLNLSAKNPVGYTLSEEFQKPWLDYQGSSYSSRFDHPARNMPVFGRELAETIGIAALSLMLNYSNEDVEYNKLLLNFVQVGIDLYYSQKNGKEWEPDGTHANGRKFPILFAGYMLDNTDMKNVAQKSGDYLYSKGYGAGNANNPPDYIDFGEDAQTFYVATEDAYPMPYEMGVYHPGTTVGKVKVTQGSNIIEGVGTNWLSMRTNPNNKSFGVKGDNQAYSISGRAYAIKSFDSDTQLTLKTNYTGETNLTGNLEYGIAEFVYYGHANTANVVDYDEFTEEQLSLPSWGIRHSTIPSFDGNEWDQAYQTDFDNSMQGIVLAAHMIGIKDAWNHNALFDYMDRHINYYGSEPGFVLDLWNLFRDDYGDVWKCLDGATKTCEKQLGVCQGSFETCANNSWLGCDYLSYNESYEGSEINRTDGLDNDCDGFTDFNDLGFPMDYFSYWKFEGNANDETGINNGTLVGNAGFVFDSAERGQVLSLDGNGDYINLTNATLSIRTNGITYSAWIKTSSYTDQAIIGLARNTDASYFTEGGIYIISNKSKITAYDTGNYYHTNGTSNINDNQWHYIVGTYNPMDSRTRIYVDGNLETTGNHVFSNYGTNTPSYANFIGRNNRHNDLLYFNGSIDDVMIYNRALGESEIAQIYCRQGGDTLDPTFCTGIPTLSPFTRLWSFLKSILTTKTGNAILTGNVVGDGNENGKRLSLIFAVLIILIVVVMIVLKRKKHKKIRISRKIKKKRAHSKQLTGLMSVIKV